MATYQCSVVLTTDQRQFNEMFDSRSNITKSRKAGMNQLERFQLRKIKRFESMRREKDGDLHMEFRLNKNNSGIIHRETIISKVGNKLVIK